MKKGDFVKKDGSVYQVDAVWQSGDQGQAEIYCPHGVKGPDWIVVDEGDSEHVGLVEKIQHVVHRFEEDMRRPDPPRRAAATQQPTQTRRRR